MPPTGPDSLDFGTLGNVKNQLNIGVIVVVRSASNGNILVGQTDIFYGTSEMTRDTIILRVINKHTVNA